MKRKNIIKMFSLCLFIMFFMALATIGRPNLNLSTADNITDATGDIIEMDGVEKTWKPTDLHKEMEILFPLIQKSLRASILKSS